MAQLFLFEEPREDRLEREVNLLRDKIDILRKGQYAKITGLQKEVKILIEQMEFLNSNIAKKGYYL